MENVLDLEEKKKLVFCGETCRSWKLKIKCEGIGKLSNLREGERQET